MRPLGMESANLLLHTLPRGLASGARSTGVGAGSGESLRVAAGEFETLIVQKMLEAMRATVGKSGLLEQSAHRKVLEGSFDRQMAEHLVRDGGGLGLAEQLHRASESRAGDTRVMPVEGRISSGFGFESSLIRSRMRSWYTVLLSHETVRHESLYHESVCDKSLRHESLRHEWLHHESLRHGSRHHETLCHE